MKNSSFVAEKKELFSTEHLDSSIKERSVRGAAITMTAKTIKFLLETGSTVVLARLLTPQDYGLIAMVTAITGFIVMFKDLGLSAATIQKSHINHNQVSNLFWINVFISFIMALILAAGAPVISWFYGEPRLTSITIALGSTFILSGLTVQHLSLLKRQMSFKSIAIINIGSISIGIIVGIVMAWYNFDYWSLVGMRIATSISTVVMLWFFCRWRPGMPVYGAGILPMIKFGSHITGFNMVNYFARNFDNILLGKFYGAGSLGLYSKAYSLMMLPIHQIRQPLNSVALPALSRVQHDPNQFKNYYIKMLTFIGFISMPIMVFMFINAKHFIYLVLGSKWLGTVDIFKILCINAFIQPSMSTTGLVLISLGQSKTYFTLGIINSSIIVLSFVVGLPWGAIGVAKSYTIAMYLILIPTLWYSYKKSPISFSDFFTASIPSAIASIGMGFILFVLQGYLSKMSDIESIVYSLIVAFLTYLAIMLLVPGGLSILRQVVSYRNYLFKRNA